MTKDQVYNMVVWAAFGVFIGGRLGYTLFYNFSYYVQHPANILAIWEGGMSFHGGLLASSSPYFGSANGRVFPPIRSQTWQLPPRRSG